MKKFNLATGKIGEEIARDYLQKKGYKILEQNYKTKYGEIDLVCQKNGQLVIVEVRTKKGEMFGSPEESLDKRKLQKIWLNARGYVERKKWPGTCRIDAVCLVLDYNNTIERLNHYQDII